MFERQCERIYTLESRVAELSRLIKEEDEELRQSEMVEKRASGDSNHGILRAREERGQHAHTAERGGTEAEWLLSDALRNCWEDILKVAEWKDV